MKITKNWQNNEIQQPLIPLLFTMISFKKPKKNFRKKTTADENDEDQTAEQKGIEYNSSGLNKSVQNKSANKNKATITKSRSSGLLSFEDELEEGEEFVLKKSKESRKLSQRVREQKKKEKLGEIQENVKAALPYAENKPEKLPDEKTVQRDENRMIVGGDSASESEDENDDFDDIRSGLSTGLIPDAATIFAMKKQRERARQLGTGTDFVPLKVSTTTTTTRYKERTTGSSSRLVREEDEDSEEERMEFKGSQRKSFPALERRKEVAKALEEANDEVETEKDGDEELDLWEQEQIKKGASIPAAQKEQPLGPALPPVEQPMPMEGTFQSIGPFPSAYYPYGQAPGLPFGFPVQSMPAIIPVGGHTITIDMVSQRIKERLDSIQQVHRSHLLEMEKHRTDVKEYKKSIISLEAKSADVSDRFQFFQEMSGYVQDLIDCLNEKVPIINDLESSMLQLLKQRALKFHQRRIDDMRDEDNQITGKVQVKGTSTSTDEFGRDRSKYEETARQRRVAEREGRRKRRRKKRIENSEHNDGMSSDDEELDAEVAKFNSDRERLLKQGSSIFEDVIDDFSSLREIKSRFEEWKFGFSDSYKEAYIQLCLPKLFSPFLRLEMLDWNPLQIKNKDFENMIWFKVAAMFGYVEGEKHIDAADSDLLPLIIEKIIIPRLTDFVQFVWDPLSTTQTELLVLLMQRLADDYPTVQKDSKNTKKLFTEVVQKIRNSINNEVYIPLYQKGLLDSKSAGASVFLERQFWSAFKLFGNVMQWKELLSLKVLQELGIDSVVNRYLIVALQQMSNSSQCLDRCKDIIDLLPKATLDGSDHVPQCLQSLARYINALAGRIFKSSLGYSEQEKRKAKVMIKRCISFLMHLQAFEFARAVARDYKIETVADRS